MLQLLLLLAAADDVVVVLLPADACLGHTGCPLSWRPSTPQGCQLVSSTLGELALGRHGVASFTIIVATTATSCVGVVA